jgi:hypothetical protein
MTSILCPDCKGRGENLCFVDRFVSPSSDELTGHVGMMKCIRCEGKGEVPAEMLTWIEQGKMIRHWRIYGNPFGGKYTSMGYRATTLGMSVSDYSSIEQGRVDNTSIYLCQLKQVTP